MPDIFDFWARMPAGSRAYPADVAVLGRASSNFEDAGLPSPNMGPLRTAPVVLLFLSPGFDEGAGEHAASDLGRAWYAGQRSGDGLLPSRAVNEPGWRWWTGTVRQFGIEEQRARETIAVLDINPYPSKSFEDRHMLSALPSYRVAVEWAQDVLFPEGEAGKRVVVCMRSAPYWGLAGALEPAEGCSRHR